MSPCSDSVTGRGPSPPHRWPQTRLSSLPRRSCTRGQRWTVPASPPAGPRSPRPPSRPSSWAVVCCPPASRRTKGEGSWGRGPFRPQVQGALLGGGGGGEIYIKESSLGTSEAGKSKACGAGCRPDGDPGRSDVAVQFGSRGRSAGRVPSSSGGLSFPGTASSHWIRPTAAGGRSSA